MWLLLNKHKMCLFVLLTPTPTIVFQLSALSAEVFISLKFIFIMKLPTVVMCLLRCVCAFHLVKCHNKCDVLNARATRVIVAVVHFQEPNCQRYRVWQGNLT